MRIVAAIVLIIFSSRAIAQTPISAQTSIPVQTPVAAQASVPPFISPQTTVFDTETGTVDTGIINDVQHVVGPDPRYVTFGGGGAASAIYPDGMAALAAYDYQRLPLIGFVGSPLPTEPAQRPKGKSATATPAQPQGVLAVRGITRLTR